MMASHRRVLPSSLINPVVGRAFAVRADAEQAAEGIERFVDLHPQSGHVHLK
jgi:hypothetical protein